MDDLTSLTDKKILERHSQLLNKVAEFNNVQKATKICLNSCYGALGNQYFRHYDIRQAEAITLSGQLAIRWIERKLNEYCNSIFSTKGVDYIIASDTDSVYINLSTLVEKVFDSQENHKDIVKYLDKVCSKKFEPFIHKAYQELANIVNAYDQKMFMKREVIANRGVWTAKKRYILNVHNSEGVQYAKPKLKIMGLETVRSSTPAFFKEKLKECYKIIIENDNDELIKYINQVKKDLYEQPYDDIAFPRGMGDINKYEGGQDIYIKGTPIHIRGALLYNKLIRKHGLANKYQTIHKGDKVRFFYMKLPNILNENVFTYVDVLPTEFNLENCIDRELQFQKAFLEPLKIVTNIIQWETEKFATLESLF